MEMIIHKTSSTTGKKRKSNAVVSDMEPPVKKKKSRNETYRKSINSHENKIWPTKECPDKQNIIITTGKSSTNHWKSTNCTNQNDK
jgi:hypothetical protein